MKGEINLQIAICDDNPADQRIMATILCDYGIQRSVHFDLIEYGSGVDLIYDVEEGRFFDVIFLDVRDRYKDEIQGIDVAYQLRKNGYEGQIVFLTTTAEFAVDSYEVDAVGYLMKPHSSKKIFAVMDKIFAEYTTKTYQIRTRFNIAQIPFNEILYIDSDNNKCILHRKDGRTYTIYKKLNEIEEELTASQFLRCHQSYLVNMDYIERADKEFELISGDIISIRQRDLKHIREIYFNYLER